MQVDVLSFAGCPNADAAAFLVRELIERTGVTAEVREGRVETPGESEPMRFVAARSGCC